MLSVLAIVAASGPLELACASERLTTPAQIQSTVAGATLELDTPIGSVLPVMFGDDGALSGNAGSRLSFFLGSSSDQGRWWIANDRLCYQWRVWFRGEKNCMKLRVDGARVAWTRDDGETGTATIVKRAVMAEAAAQTPATPVAPQIAAAEAQPPAKLAAPSALGGPLATPVPAQKAEVERAAPQSAAPTAKSAKTVARAADSWNTATIPAKPAQPQNVASAAIPASTNPGPSYRVRKVRADDTLNVRNAPDAASAISGRLPHDAREIRIIGTCIGLWCPIRRGTVSGWVNRLYLDARPYSATSATLMRADRRGRVATAVEAEIEPAAAGPISR